MNLAKTIIGDDLKMKNLIKARELFDFLELNDFELERIANGKFSSKMIYDENRDALVDIRTAEEILDTYFKGDNYEN